jgi:hypothetical protein
MGQRFVVAVEPPSIHLRPVTYAVRPALRLEDDQQEVEARTDRRDRKSRGQIVRIGHYAPASDPTSS